MPESSHAFPADAGTPGPPPDLRPEDSAISEGYLHIGPDWRITFADIGSRREPRRERPEYLGRLLWDVFPDVLGSPFEAEYRAAMVERRPRRFVAYYRPIATWMENRLFPAGDGIALFYRDLTLRQEAQRQAERRRAQQAAVAELGQLALEEATGEELLDRAVREVARLLDVPFAKFVATVPGSDELVLQAGVGWRDGVVGAARVPTGPLSQAGYAIAAHGPVAVEDLATETRFTPTPLFVEHGVVSGISVLVGPRDAPLGVLGAHSAVRRTFSQEDLDFLQGMANLLGAAIARGRVEGELRRHRDDLQRRNHQQEAVARLGQAALEGIDTSLLCDLAVSEVARSLEVEFAKLVEPLPGGRHLRLRSGVGWRPGVVGRATISAEGGSQAAYALQAHGPVIVEDLATETRFAAPPLFVEHGIVSGLSVLVGPRDAPLGVLGAHTRARRHFVEDDLNFLQAVANLLAAALERSSIEAELRRHRDDLERLVRDRTAKLEATLEEMQAFSYSVSHDLRAPLRAIDGFSQLLVTQYAGQLPAPAQALLGRVRESAQRMGHLIESLLALARIGRAQLHPERVDVSAEAAAILAELRAREPDRRVRWEVQPGLAVHADPALLRIALANLLENAWKFTRGKDDAAIVVERDPATRAIAVRDNGVGYDPAHAQRLFEPFQRMHSLAEFEGTGVGLATVSRIARRHGGRAWSTSAPGQGATFFLAFGSAGPLDDGEGTAAGGSPAQAGP